MQAFIQSKHWFSIALAIGLATLTTYLIACDLVILTISLVAIFSSQVEWYWNLESGWLLLLHGAALLGWTRQYWQKQEAR
jgi:uncharacterized protein YhhL (DUF1145 family)